MSIYLDSKTFTIQIPDELPAPNIDGCYDQGYLSDGPFVPQLFTARRSRREIIDSFVEEKSKQTTEEDVEMTIRPCIMMHPETKEIVMIEDMVLTNRKTGEVIYDRMRPDFGIHCGCPENIIEKIRTQIFGDVKCTMAGEQDIPRGIRMIAQTMCSEKYPRCYFIIYSTDVKVREVIISAFLNEVRIRRAGQKIRGYLVQLEYYETEKTYNFDITVGSLFGEGDHQLRKFIIMTNDAKNPFNDKQLEAVMKGSAAALRHKMGSSYP